MWYFCPGIKYPPSSLMFLLSMLLALISMPSLLFKTFPICHTAPWTSTSFSTITVIPKRSDRSAIEVYFSSFLLIFSHEVKAFLTLLKTFTPIPFSSSSFIISLDKSLKYLLASARLLPITVSISFSIIL